jgi:hypothetical protein
MCKFLVISSQIFASHYKVPLRNVKTSSFIGCKHWAINTEYQYHYTTHGRKQAAKEMLSKRSYQEDKSLLNYIHLLKTTHYEKRKEGFSFSTKGAKMTDTTSTM